MKLEEWQRFCQTQRRDQSTGGKLVQDRPARPQDGGDQSLKRPALEQVLPDQETNLQRPLVRITGYRVRLLDVDAFPGSCKAIIDGLRACNLIPGDSPKEIRLQTDQFQVRHYCEERTELEIIWP